MTELEVLKMYMEPNYQTAGDETRLSYYLNKYSSPACAAYHLWAELAGKTLTARNVESLNNGAESTKYVNLTTQYNVFIANADYYKELCEQENGAGTSFALYTKKSDVAGVPSANGTGYGV